jgi:hypothetical protein
MIFMQMLGRTYSQSTFLWCYYKKEEIIIGLVCYLFHLISKGKLMMDFENIQTNYCTFLMSRIFQKHTSIIQLGDGLQLACMSW